MSPSILGDTDHIEICVYVEEEGDNEETEREAELKTEVTPHMLRTTGGRLGTWETGFIF